MNKIVAIKEFINTMLNTYKEVINNVDPDNNIRGWRILKSKIDTVNLILDFIKLVEEEDEND